MAATPTPDELVRLLGELEDELAQTHKTGTLDFHFARELQDRFATPHAITTQYFDDACRLLRRHGKL